jgi:hypothetical protein
MTSVNSNQRKDSCSNSLAGTEFEQIAFEYFKTKEHIILDKKYVMNLGIALKKEHEFDLGSKENKILVECKSCTWTKSGRVPSAKISTWNEAMFYFNLAPKEYKKIFFVLMNYNKEKGKTLAQYYREHYYHFIPKDVLFYEYDQKNGHCKIYDFKQIENAIKNP